MSARGWYFAGSISCLMIALVGFSALYEHFAGVMDADWLSMIFPFGLALNPVGLSSISIGALFASWLFRKLAKTH